MANYFVRMVSLFPGCVFMQIELQTMDLKIYEFARSVCRSWEIPDGPVTLTFDFDYGCWEG